jgi:hypothetical protein
MLKSGFLQGKIFPVKNNFLSGIFNNNCKLHSGEGNFTIPLAKIFFLATAILLDLIKLKIIHTG